MAGADPGFQVRRVHLKKLRRVEGGSNIFGVFRVKNQDFKPKNHIFSPWIHPCMVCTACTEFGEPNGMFVTGCTCCKVDSPTKHEKSKQHEKCALVTKAKLKSRGESFSWGGITQPPQPP